MQTFQIIPKEVEKAFGADGAEKFVLFLNQGFENQKTNVIQAVSDAFHDHVTTEVSRIRLDVADLRTDMAELRAEVKTDMAELRTELKIDNASLRAEFKSDLAAQTRWILIALLGGAVIYPVSIKLIDRLFPAPQPSVIMQTAPSQP
jgi:hypothetical protein